MDLIAAVVLGIALGITEFLPISSLGHSLVLEALRHTDAPQGFGEWKLPTSYPPSLSEDEMSSATNCGQVGRWRNRSCVIQAAAPDRRA